MPEESYYTRSVSLRKKIISCAGALFLLFLQPNLRAENTAANTASAPGQWEEASRPYRESLSTEGAQPAAFFYNFGTAALQSGAAGEAFVLLTRAALMNPFDPATRHNLRLAEAKVPASARAIRPANWISWWPQPLRAVPWTAWLLTSLLLFLPWFHGAWKTGRFLSQRWPWLATGASFLALASLAGWQTRHPAAGLLHNAKVLSGPGSTYPEISSLEPGSLVSLEEKRDGWTKIRYLDARGQDAVGWVETPTTLPLE